MAIYLRMSLILGLCAGIWGCGPSDEGPGQVSVQLGAGLDSFHVIEADSEVDIIAGPQGGFHIWTAIRVQDLEQERILVSLQGHLTATETPAGRLSKVRISMGGQNEDGSRDRPGLFLYIDDPTEIDGQTVRLEVTIETEAGVGSDEQTVTVHAPK